MESVAAPVEISPIILRATDDAWEKAKALGLTVLNGKIEVVIVHGRPARLIRTDSQNL